jgi:hypothetical protein
MVVVGRDLCRFGESRPRPMRMNDARAYRFWERPQEHLHDIRTFRQHDRCNLSWYSETVRELVLGFLRAPYRSGLVVVSACICCMTDVESKS